ncbi:MAG: DNA gyrase subunit A [Candidatus Pacearchaeota archaeon]
MAESKNTQGTPEDNSKNVFQTEVGGEMKKAYLDYAMSVVVSRAIPAIEDGMKPVQRRILYSMQQMGLKPSGATKKSARIVGDVIGKFHPHGDAAVYDTMVRLAQDFSLRYPLVFGQGNFGSIDGDPAAAMRYTEAKLMDISYELLQDIEKETVPFQANYDNSLKEPQLLPGKLPNLLLNGATGIAVGMATNIPSHNLTEVCDAIEAYVNNSEITFDELLQIVHGPDFATGGSVWGDMKEIYENGKGKLTLRGKVTTEKGTKKDRVVITEIPYALNKATLVTQIAKLVQDKKIKDISDLRDESSKGKTRIVVELKKGVDPKYVINSLYKFTRLQDSMHVNFLALHDGQPKVMNLKQMLDAYVQYRKRVITNRCRYDLRKAKERKEIVEGLLKALSSIEEVVETIKKSDNATKALEILMQNYDLTKRQAQAVLDTKLQQLTSLEVDKLKKEGEELDKKITELEKILADVNEILKIIKKEVRDLKKNYGDERKTKLLKNIKEISEKDIVQDKEVVVTITEKGYCKRMDLESYKKQGRGGKGIMGSNLSGEDFVKQMITCSTHDYLMFFTTRGRVLWLKAYDVPAFERYSRGKAIVNMLGLKDESITSVISVNNFENYLFMATEKGVVKKTSLQYFSKPRASGIRAINLPEDNTDFLVNVQVVQDNQEVMLSTREGKAIRFNVDEVRQMGRSSYGVKGINLEKEDKVVGLNVLDKPSILTITENGFGKRTSVEDYRKTARAGKGVINIKVGQKTGKVVTTICVDKEDNIIISSAKGMVIRTSLENIREMGRATQGVTLVKLQRGDKVTDLVSVRGNKG